MADIGKSKGYDQTFKFLSDHDPLGFLALVGAVSLDAPVNIEKLEGELVTPSRAVDRLYRVTDADGSRLVHVEVNTRWRDNLPARVADYGARIWLAEQEPIDSYVLILVPDPDPPTPPPLGLIQVGDLMITKGYRLIRLWELNAREWLASGHPHILPLIPLMRGDEAELRASAEVISQLPDEEQRSELSAYLSIVGGLRYDRNIIRQILGGLRMVVSIHEFAESSVYQEIAEEARRREHAATIYSMLRRGAALNFPELKLGPEIETITDLDALESLCLTMHELPSAATLQERLAELIKASEARLSVVNETS